MMLLMKECLHRLVIEPSVANVPSLEVFGRIYDEGEAGMEFDSPHLPTNAENMRSYSYHYKTILIASSPGPLLFAKRKRCFQDAARKNVMIEL